MASNKYYLGDLITQRREKNPGGDLPIRGVSKEGLQPPKQIDADTSIYNLYYRNDFVYNPARMELGSIAFNDEYDQAICSSLYEVFYVHRTDLVIPEYLALFVKHPEFARYCNYIGNGSAREYCRFDDISGIPIYLPPISEQRKIVHDYQVIENRIELLQEIIKKTDAQMRMYVRDWIKDHAVKEGKLCDYCRMEYGFTETARSDEVGPKFLRITDITGAYIDWDAVPYCPITDGDLKKYKLQKGDVVVARTGATSGAAKMIGGSVPTAVFASFLVRVVANERELQPFLGLTITDEDFYKYVQANAEVAGSAQPQANPPLLGQYNISVPSKDALPDFNDTVNVFLNYMDKCASEISKLNALQVLLSGFAGTAKGA